MTRFATIALIALAVGRTDEQGQPAARPKTTAEATDADARAKVYERLDTDETDADRFGRPGVEAPTAFHLGLLGKWVLESGRIGGRTSERAHKPKALGATTEYAVAVFDYDRVSFGEDSDRPASVWSFDLEEEADPRRILLSEGDKTVKGAISHSMGQMVLSLAMNGGDFPEDFGSEGDDSLVLRYRRDETDPQWLKRKVAQFRDFAAKVESGGAASQRQHAAFLREQAEFIQSEVDSREQAKQALEQAKELRQAGKHQSAKERERDAENLRMRALEISAERREAVDLYEHEKRLRQEVKQLNARAGTLREEGRFAEAGEVETEVRNLLRDLDPELQRANELKQRASQARFDGKHQDAELFEREANRLLENVKQRWSSPDAATATAQREPAAARHPADARGAAEAFVAAVLAGETADAAAFTTSKRAASKEWMEEFRNVVGVESLDIESVRVKEMGGIGLAVSPAIKLTKPHPDVGETVRVVLQLAVDGGAWKVRDVDLWSDVDARKAIERYQEEYPDVKRTAPASAGNATLREDYSLLEKRAARLAEQYRDRPDEASPTPGDAEALKRLLTEVVDGAFEARQALQRAELDEIRQRLARIERQIAARDRVKQQIVDRRVQDLLNPGLKRDSGVSDTGKTSSDAGEKPLATSASGDALAQLQGRWKIDFWLEGSENRFHELRWVTSDYCEYPDLTMHLDVRGDLLSIQHDPSWSILFMGSLEDTSAEEPGTFVLHFPNDEETPSVKGRFSLSEGELRICWNDNLHADDPIPVVVAGKNVTYLQCIRGDTVSAISGEKQATSELEGDWRLESIVGRGILGHEQGLKVRVRGGVWTIVREQGEFSYQLGLNDATNPKTIDLIVEQRPPHPPFFFCGLYDLRGDTLTIAWGRSPAVRPTDFGGENGAIHTWKRLEPRFVEGSRGERPPSASAESRR